MPKRIYAHHSTHILFNKNGAQMGSLSTHIVLQLAFILPDTILIHLILFFSKTLFIYLFILERERERNINVWLPPLPTGDLALDPSMCPNRESNRRPSSSQVSTQSTEPHQPGQHLILLSDHLVLLNGCSIMHLFNPVQRGSNLEFGG